ncbi:MAG TPA: hypothetical protein ENK46_13225 [Flavobacteriia bacterium]|jgi:hypothetical protein|nr:hypothetical protein [Flavobacteriia bacterium]
MKNSFNVEILEISKSLTNEELDTFRIKLKPLLNLEGIMSICLEAKELYVEFDASSFDLDSFKLILTALRFPLKVENELVSI